MSSGIQGLVDSRFEEFAIWPDHGQARVDVVDSEGDVASNICREQADRLIMSHNQALEALVRALQYVQDAGGDAFDILWDPLDRKTLAVPENSEAEADAVHQRMVAWFFGRCKAKNIKAAKQKEAV